MSDLMLVSHLILWALVIGEGVVILALARQIGLLHKRIAPFGARMTDAGPEVGKQAPTISAVDQHQRAVVLDGTQQRPTLITFISATCGTCANLLPALRSIAKSERKRMDVVLVSLTDDIGTNKAFLAQHQIDDLPLVTSPIIAVTYEVMSPPYSVVLDAHNIVLAKGVANSFEQLESLVNAVELGYSSEESRYYSTTPGQAIIEETAVAQR